MGCERFVWSAARRRRRVFGGRVDEHPASLGEYLVLAWHAGLRVCRSRAPLADPAFYRFGLLALAHVAGDPSRSRETGQQLLTPDDVSDFKYRHSTVLRSRAHVWPAQQPGDRGVLALVGGPSLGRGLL